MKILNKLNPIIRAIIISQVLPWGLNFISFVIGMFIEGAFALEPYLSDTVFQIANWPSLLLKIYPTITTINGTVLYDFEHGIFNPLIIIVNAVGWAIIGFLVGLIISFIKSRKQYKTL